MKPLKYRIQYEAFEKYLVGKRLSAKEIIVIGMSSTLTLVEGLIRNIPGPIGMLVRRFYYKFRLKKLGQKTLIDVGVYFLGPRNISIGSYTWIDVGVKLEANLGEIHIGNRNHIGSYVIMGSREPIYIGDFVGIGAGARIYSNSEVPWPGLHMSGPMVPEAHKSFKSKTIYINKDALVGTNSVVLPGASLGKGAVLGALSLLNKKVLDWEIWAGVPAKKVGMRPSDKFKFEETN